MADKLDLTEDQHNQALNTMEEFRPQLIETRTAIKENMKKLHNLDSSTADYAAQSSELADQQGVLIAEMIKLGTGFNLALEEILNDEQKAKYQEFKQKRHYRWKHHDDPENQG